MEYPGGERIELGDTVSVEMPNGWAEARIVMLGSTRKHLDMLPEHLAWYTGEGMEATEVVVEWLEDGKPRAGAYMSTHVNCCIKLIARAAS